jgi:hypothetical protein
MNWWSRLFGPRGPEPVGRVEDPTFGPLLWSEDDESWVGQYGGYQLALGYAGEAALAPELLAYARAFLGEDGSAFTRTLAAGKAARAAEFLAVVRSPGYRLDPGTRTEVAVRAVGDEAAVVRHRYQGAGSFEGTSFTDDHRCVMVWERHAGQWRLVMEQCSFSSK